MGKIFHGIPAIPAIVMVLILTVSMSAFACTGVYVGANVSEDGTILIARSNDNQDVWANYVTIVPREENKPGRTMPVDINASVFAKIPGTTFKYTMTPWMDSTRANNGLPHDATAGTNEYGVVMTMAVTAFTNDAALAADPEPENGLAEQTAVDLVICQSKTARKAVDVLLGLIDTYGSSQSNIAMIADQKEAWYVEMYTGHQYAAVKLPSDKVAVFGNEFTMEYLSSYEESKVPNGLESVAVDDGFAVYGKNGELNLMKTYADKTYNYCHMRTWIGHKVLSPSTTPDRYSKADNYPLTFQPDEKVSLQDVMTLMRNRYEGTEYDPDATGRIDMRVIGTDTAMSVHILQIYPDYPAEMSNVLWESTSPALYGVFVPVSIACTSVKSSYGLNQPSNSFGDFDYNTYPWYAFKALNTLCLADYAVYGTPVRDYWQEAESGMVSSMAHVLKIAASNIEHSPVLVKKYIAAYCTAVQNKAFQDAKSIINTELWYQSKNSNTMKSGKNPETGEVTGVKKVLEPVKINLNAASYAEVPEFNIMF